MSKRRPPEREQESHRLRSPSIYNFDNNSSYNPGGNAIGYAASAVLHDFIGRQVPVAVVFPATLPIIFCRLLVVVYS